MNIVRVVAGLTFAMSVLAFSPALADDGWVMACAEGPRPCSIDGTRLVQYGANGKFQFGVATNRLLCSNETFGDPIPGVAKACWYKKSALEKSLGVLVADRDNEVRELTADVDALQREIRDLEADLRKSAAQVEKLQAELRRANSQRSLPPLGMPRDRGR